MAMEPRSARVVVLGERGVGKSSFLAALTGCTPAPPAQQPSFAVHVHEGGVLELLECSTHTDYAAGRDLLLLSAQAWIVLYASGSKASLARAREWECIAGTKQVPILLLGVIRDAPAPSLSSSSSNTPATPMSLPLTFSLSDPMALQDRCRTHAASLMHSLAYNLTLIYCPCPSIGATYEAGTHRAVM